MKEISMDIKYRVIELFLKGYTFDEIVEQVNISKGSVVGIIDNFKGGGIQLPYHMTVYMDELRRLVVDMKKNRVSVVQLKAYQRIHSKLQEMGANSEQVDAWFETLQDIASSSAFDGE